MKGMKGRFVRKVGWMGGWMGRSGRRGKGRFHSWRLICFFIIMMSLEVREPSRKNKTKQKQNKTKTKKKINSGGWFKFRVQGSRVRVDVEGQEEWGGAVEWGGGIKEKNGGK